MWPLLLPAFTIEGFEGEPLPDIGPRTMASAVRGESIEPRGCHFRIAEHAAHSLKLRLVVMMTLVRS